MLLPVGQIAAYLRRQLDTHDTHPTLNFSPGVAVKTCVLQPTGLTRLDSSHLEQVSD